jgi:hypothetical protein
MCLYTNICLYLGIMNYPITFYGTVYRLYDLDNVFIITGVLQYYNYKLYNIISMNIDKIEYNKILKHIREYMKNKKFYITLYKDNNIILYYDNINVNNYINNCILYFSMNNKHLYISI